MKRLLILTGILLTAFIAGRAQGDELNRLADIVKSLRSGGETAYNRAIKDLGGDKLWTPMDELGTDKTAECRVTDRVPGFRLNAVMTNAENAQRYQTTTGNHLNGADTRFNYSLYEKTLKAGKTVSYTLNGRQGDQTFLLIPYKTDKVGLQAEGRSGSENFKAVRLNDGTIKLTGKVAKGNPVRLTVSNTGNENLSYVVINYNARN